MKNDTIRLYKKSAYFHGTWLNDNDLLKLIKNGDLSKRIVAVKIENDDVVFLTGEKSKISIPLFELLPPPGKEMPIFSRANIAPDGLSIKFGNVYFQTAQLFQKTITKLSL